jgi:hypothetical protein
MQLRDLPYYHHFSQRELERRKIGHKIDTDGETQPHITLKGTNEILEKKLGKYLKRKDNGT